MASWPAGLISGPVGREASSPARCPVMEAGHLCAEQTEKIPLQKGSSPSGAVDHGDPSPSNCALRPFGGSSAGQQVGTRDGRCGQRHPQKPPRSQSSCKADCNVLLLEASEGKGNSRNVPADWEDPSRGRGCDPVPGRLTVERTSRAFSAVARVNLFRAIC